MFFFPAAAAAFAALIAWRAARTAHRRSSVALWLWALGFAQFAVASGAAAVGVGAGWSPATYRTYYLFGAILNVVWLALGSVWLLAPRAIALPATVVVVAASLYATIVTVGAPLLPEAALAIRVETIPAGGNVMPDYVRDLSRLFSLGGTVVLLGGLGWSIARRRQRARSLGLLFAGVMVVAVASALVRAGAVVPFSVGLAAGVGVMYLGFADAGRPRSAT